MKVLSNDIANHILNDAWDDVLKFAEYPSGIWIDMFVETWSICRDHVLSPLGSTRHT